MQHDDRAILQRYAAAWALLALAACQGPASPTPAVRRAPIVNGALDDAHPTVGIIYAEQAKGACTGTLIAPDKVLTAAHCVFEGDASGGFYYDPVYFFLGDEPRVHVAAAAVARHPDYDGVIAADVAVLWLSHPITSVTPSPLAQSAPALGQDITLVGYGLSAPTANDFGTKRYAPQKIAELDAEWYSINCAAGSAACICEGDSGGPSFSLGAIPAVVGVHSGSSQLCSAYGYDMRVDVFSGWITSSPPQRAFYGGVCSAAADCLSGLCVVSADGARYCSEACTPDGDPCPYFDSCGSPSGAGGEHACLPNTGGDRELGAPCAWGLDCFSGECVELPAPIPYGACTRHCDTLAQDCPDHFECRTTDAGAQCVPTGDLTWRRDAGVQGDATVVGDAQTVVGDGGAVAGDGSPASADGGGTTPDKGDGGGCVIGGAAGPHDAFWVGLVALLMLVRRRRRRR